MKMCFFFSLCRLCVLNLTPFYSDFFWTWSVRWPTDTIHTSKIALAGGGLAGNCNGQRIVWTKTTTTTKFCCSLMTWRGLKISKSESEACRDKRCANWIRNSCLVFWINDATDGRVVVWAPRDYRNENTHKCQGADNGNARHQFND